MSLTSQLSNLTTRIGTEFKSVRASIGNLTSLTTTEKGTIVGAINEVKAGLGVGGDVTADSIIDATTVGKSVLRASSEGAARAAIGAGVGNSNLVIGPLSTNAKAGDYQPGWSDVTGKPAVIAAGVDASAARTAIGAQSASDVDAKITALVDSSPAALDTLGELASALGNDPNFATTITTALGNRLRVDASQSLTEPHKTQGRTNLDVYSKTEIGNPETDFVAVFEAALV